MDASNASLEDRYEILKDIGDGSFGSVVLARTRSAGAQSTVKRNTLVAVKTMKKTFSSFSQCLELREVIFLKTLPTHPHLVPAYDIFLDPVSRKLHIAMESMDGNLYQLIKTRDHKPFDGATVKSILYQILSGLEHIHQHSFFHRDIKPENILVSSSKKSPRYSVKLADFGLAREMHSAVPYTTYVSTRWYRAPEVLLRAGKYSAPVDIWALGAMAVEIATLKPLFPGGNEVDQVWRVCEIMGSPGTWINKSGQKMGGGEWKEGVRLAAKLGFSFPKMAPHCIDTLLPSAQWPHMWQFVTWCLMWDPASRPTSTQALQHDYFADAIDPLRPKSAASSSKKSSWFRRSMTLNNLDDEVANTPPPPPSHKTRSNRTTWTTGNVAPIPILPSIKPVSPLCDTDAPKKIGRQLSVNSHGNHYAEYHRQEAERALNGMTGQVLPSPTASREGFFSHLRKRARRFSGRHAEESTLPTSTTLPDLVDPVASVKVQRKPLGSAPKRSSSLPFISAAPDSGPVSSRTRRSIRQTRLEDADKQRQPRLDEADELLDEAIVDANRAARRLEVDKENVRPQKRREEQKPPPPPHEAYLTPSPTKDRVRKPARDSLNPSGVAEDSRKKQAATPPYDETEWAAAAAAEFLAAQAEAAFR